MSSVLVDFEIRFYTPDVSPYLAVTDHFNPEPNVPILRSAKWKNKRFGGCDTAEIELMSSTPDYLSGLASGSSWDYIKAGSFVVIRVQCEGESNLKKRWAGIVTKCGQGEGTDVKTRSFECLGHIHIARHVPLLLILDSTTPKLAMQAIVPSIAGSAKCSYATDFITYDPSYTVEKMDFIDTPADRAIEALGRLAGPDCSWGIVPTDSTADVAFPYSKLHMTEMSATALDFGFEVGDPKTISAANRTTSIEGYFPGGYFTCSRKVGGGDLTLYRKPASGDVFDSFFKPLAMIDMPEIADPRDLWEFSGQWVEEHNDIDDQIDFKCINFGKQPWANERFNAPIEITMRAGDSPYALRPLSYETEIDEHGAIDTTFQLGKHPDIELFTVLPALARAVIVSNSDMFWSAAELAAGNRDAVREWRRTAADTWNIRSFFTARFGNDPDAVYTKEQWQDELTGGEPALYSGWTSISWRVNSENAIEPKDAGMSNVPSVFIPTGTAMALAALFVDMAPVTYGSVTSAEQQRWWWDWETLPDCGELILITCGIWLYLQGTPGNNWDFTVVFLYDFDTGCPELPLILALCRPCMADNSTVASTYATMASEFRKQILMFAIDGGYDDPQAAYCVAMRRASGSNTLYLATGWWEGESFNSDHWSAGAAPGSTSCGTIDVGSLGSGIQELQFVVHVPDGTDNTFTVEVYEGDDRTTCLYDSTDTHGASTVTISGSAGWVGDGCYYCGMEWNRYGKYGDDYQPYGIKWIRVESGGSVDYAVTRDGSAYTTGTSGAAVTLTGGTEWADGRVGLRFIFRVTQQEHVPALGLGFRTSDEA